MSHLHTTAWLDRIKQLEPLNAECGMRSVSGNLELLRADGRAGNKLGGFMHDQLNCLSYCHGLRAATSYTC